MPPIQALVINKSSGCPGAGFAFFAPDAKDFKRATRRGRRLIVDSMLKGVFNFGPSGFSVGRGRALRSENRSPL